MFYTNGSRYIYESFHLVFTPNLCYFIVRKGDTNVQVRKPLRQQIFGMQLKTVHFSNEDRKCEVRYVTTNSINS